MKKIALALAAVTILTTGAASAADLAARPYTKAAPMVPPVYDWAGFYVGGNGGWATSRRCADFAGVPLGCHDADGGVAGGQVGYRWQTGSWVFGLEAQGDWADLRGSNANVLVPAVIDNSRLRAFGLFTGQVGYAWNNALFYVKGGAAVTDNRYLATVAGVEFLHASDTRWGGSAGVGFEYGFTPNWSFALEYDHLFMGNHSVGVFTTPGGAFVTNANVSGDTDMITARVNYRFGGPVVARY